MTEEQFYNDARTVFAVIRGLEIIGGATKHIPLDFRERHPELPWREMAGIRDKLNHQYFGVNLIVVWRTVTEDLPTIEPLLRNIIASERDEDEKAKPPDHPT